MFATDLILKLNYIKIQMIYNAETILKSSWFSVQRFTDILISYYNMDKYIDSKTQRLLYTRRTLVEKCLISVHKYHSLLFDLTIYLDWMLQYHKPIPVL